MQGGRTQSPIVGLTQHIGVSVFGSKEGGGSSSAAECAQTGLRTSVTHDGLTSVTVSILTFPLAVETRSL